MKGESVLRTEFEDRRASRENREERRVKAGFLFLFSILLSQTDFLLAFFRCVEKEAAIRPWDVRSVVTCQFAGR
ncbi:hypothetical protein GCWU000246_00362 [Jonquetella anthropi E3_33 E1]|nr:hypothetical protein GCWU000246_00362 [Jonquetella anthropi E3_33 E1]